MKRKRKLVKTKPRATREKVAAAAVICFEKYGVSRTKMSDIAEQMGVARQTVYRMFETRFELLEYIAAERVEVLADKLRNVVEKEETLRGALARGLPLSIELGRNDHLLTEIIQEGGDEHFKIFTFGGDPRVHKIMLDVYREHIEEARAKDQLSTIATNEEIIDWLNMVGSILNVRSDLGRKEHEAIIDRFVLNSLVKHEAP